MYRQRSNRNVLVKIIESDNLSPIKRQRQSGDELIYSPISKIVQDLRNSSLSPSDDECKLYAESTARDLVFRGPERKIAMWRKFKGTMSNR
ncbi:hypothetical protein PV325_007914 [Microctonus aethiopoides]|nr:hypothetical protein PV325_007914 [Microctonus aethiopoides]